MTAGVTRYLARFIDFLFLDNPQGTAMGALGGAVAMFFVRAFQPVLQKQDLVDLLGVPPFLYLCVGVFLANYARYRRGNALPAPVEARLIALRKEIRAGRLPSTEAQRLYRELLEETMASVLPVKKRRRATR